MIATIKVGARLYRENNFDCYVWPIESENSKTDLVFTCEQLPHSSTFICTAPGFGTPEAFGKGPLRVHNDSLVHVNISPQPESTKARKIEKPIETPLIIKGEDVLWKNTTPANETITDGFGFKHKDSCSTNPANEVTGAKWDDGKADYSFLPSRAIEEVLKVYAGGAKKYGRDNYKMGISYSRVFSAALRHLYAWWRCEEKDSESGLSHLAHACWNVLTLLEYIQDVDYERFDDRLVKDK